MKILFSSTITFLFLVSIVSALLLIVYVNALITVPQKITFPPSLIGEEQNRILFIVNSTVTDTINISSICDKPALFSAIIVTPVGSTNAQFNFNNNGTTFITPNLTQGNVMLKKRSLSQGISNCTLIFGTTDTTNITFVGELP